LKDDNPIFRRPYKFSEVERALVQAWITKLMDARLVEWFRGQYALTIVMQAKNNIFGNWIEHYMCGDYHPLNNELIHTICHTLVGGDFDSLG
jgi:hypothetical protein